MIRRIRRVSGTCVNSDCFSVLPTLPDRSFDALITDVPYDIGVANWDVIHANTNSAYLGASPAQLGKSNFKTRGKPIAGWNNADRLRSIEFYGFNLRWATLAYRLLKPGSPVIVFAGRRFFHRTAVALEDSGLLIRDVIAWNRSIASYRAQKLSVVLNRRGLHKTAKRIGHLRLGNLRPTFEPVIFAFKPYAKTVTDNVLENGLGAYDHRSWKAIVGSLDNAVTCDVERPRLFEAQKPVRLISALIRLTTPVGARIIDPFAGSGTVAVAAMRTKRSYLMIERDRQVYRLMLGRLSS